MIGNMLNSQLATYLSIFQASFYQDDSGTIFDDRGDIFSPREFTRGFVRAPTAAGILPTGNGHLVNSRGCLYSNRPLRERFPREPTTSGTSHYGSSRDFFNGHFCPESVHYGISLDVDGASFC